MTWFGVIKALLCPECGNRTLEKIKEFPPRGNYKSHRAVFKCSTPGCENEEVF